MAKSGILAARKTAPDFAPLHPGYKWCSMPLPAAILLFALTLALPCAQAAEPRPPDRQAFLDIYR